MARAPELSSYNKKPHFFKVFFPQLSSERLSVPPAFWKHIKGESPGIVYLTGPSGNFWQVDLIESKRELFFQNGWEVFVDDHSLQTGDFLVFRYDGNSCFTVLIFDTSACEKDEAFHASSTQEVVFLGENNARKNAEDNFVQVLDFHDTNGNGNALGVHPLSLKRPISSIEKKTEHQISANKRRLRAKEVSAKVLPNKPVRSFRGSIKEKFRVHANHIISDSIQLSPQTEVDLTGPSKRALTMVPETSVPQQRIEGKSMDVVCHGHESSLREKNGVDKKHAPICSLLEKPKSSRMSVVRKSCRNHLTANGMKPKLGSEYSRFMQLGDFLSQRRRISKQEIDKALKLANSFKSENPFAVVVMRDSYVYRGFYMIWTPYWDLHGQKGARVLGKYLPVSFVRAYLPLVSKQVKLWDPSGRSWNVKYIRHGSSRGAFSGGWRALSYKNNIEEHDVCVFELVKKVRKYEIRVHIFRVVEEITPLIRNSSYLAKPKLLALN